MIGPIDYAIVDTSVTNAAPRMLEALREVAGDHILQEDPSAAMVCCFCYADHGKPHENECTMNVVLAAIDVAEGRVPCEVYTVGDGDLSAVARAQYTANVGDPRR